MGGNEDLVALAHERLERHRRSKSWWPTSLCKACGETWPCRVWRNANATIELAEGRIPLPELPTIQFNHSNTRWPS